MKRKTEKEFEKQLIKQFTVQKSTRSSLLRAMKKLLFK
jgi:hypothetical protein